MKVVLRVVRGPHEGQSFEFDGHDNFIVGRGKSAQFRLPEKDEFFSRHHFLIEVNPPLCRLLDLHSRNGTFVNKQRVTSVELKDGDVIRGGKTVLQVAIAAESTPALETPPSDSGPATIVPRDWPQSGSHPSRQPPARDGQGGSTEIAPVEASSMPLASERPAPSPHRAVPISAETGPQPFPGYRVLREIGRGGMGVVYQAVSDLDGATVAIKSVTPTVAASADDLRRFAREAEVLRQLEHPHIVPFREIATGDGNLYFVMQYVESQNGEQLTASCGGTLPVVRAVRITCQLLSALAFAHTRGYVHRDVKPSNLLVENRSGTDHVWLADFGLARAYQSSRLSGLTMTGDIGGTTPYMAPEQITDFRNVDPAADQYSAAATLYYLLTGHHAYDFPRDVARQLLMILQESPIPIDRRRTDLPQAVVTAVHRALAREPAQRFANADLFRRQLESTILGT
jgi:serine/threonine protein kinase